MITAVLFALVALQPPALAEPIQAPLLHREFVTNALDADAKYKGKSVTVQGFVTRIEKQGDRYVVLLMVAQGRGLKSVPGIACQVAPSAADGFRAVRPDTRITITGTCKGSEDDFTGYKGTVVVLTDCRLAK